jgi:hypothetical protein
VMSNTIDQLKKKIKELEEYVALLQENWDL